MTTLKKKYIFVFKTLTILFVGAVEAKIKENFLIVLNNNPNHNSVLFLKMYYRTFYNLYAIFCNQY